MYDDKNQFITIESKEDGGVVTFEDNGQGKIVDIGKIQITLLLLLIMFFMLKT